MILIYIKTAYDIFYYTMNLQSYLFTSRSFLVFPDLKIVVGNGCDFCVLRVFSVTITFEVFNFCTVMENCKQIVDLSLWCSMSIRGMYKLLCSLIELCLRFYPYLVTEMCTRLRNEECIHFYSRNLVSRLA